MSIFRVPILISFPGPGSPGANIWHIRTVSDSPTDELTQASAMCGLISSFYFGVVNYIPNQTTINIGTVVEEETQREIVPAFTSRSGAGTGSIAQALAIVVTWKTTIAARRGRGRTFVGPLATAAQQTDGSITDSVRTAVQSAAQTLVDGSMAFGNGAVGVYGYENAWTGTGPRPAGQPRIFRDFVGRTVRDQFGILRSRRD